MKEENTMTTEERAAAGPPQNKSPGPPQNNRRGRPQNKPPAQAEGEAASVQAGDRKAEAPAQAALPEKFRSVDALVKAYEALEAEFTRRSQRLRALEQANKAPRAQGEPSPVPTACAQEQDAFFRGGHERPFGAE